MTVVPPARSASHRRIVVEAGAVGLVLGLLVVLPWVAGGYVLLLDWVSGPSSTISPGLYGLSDNALDAMPWRLGIEAMRTVFGAQATSWLIVLLPFPIAAAGAAHLMRMGRLPSYAAAIAAVCTPVVVDRVMAGHVAYLLGISLLPWLLSSALNARTQQRWFSARTAGWYALAIAVSPHMAWIGGVVLLLVTLLPRMSVRDVVRLLLTGLAAAGIYAYAAVVVLSGVPTLRIGAADLEAFATASGPGGILPTVLTLHGFWRDWDNQVRLVLGPAFWLLVLAVGAVIILGLVVMLRQGNRRGRLAVAFIVVGAILAAGTQGPFGWLYQWAFDTVPLFTTMREPAKWLALVQLGYIIGFAAGVQALQSSARVPAALRRPLPGRGHAAAAGRASGPGLGPGRSRVDHRVPRQLGCRCRAPRPGAGAPAVPALARLPAVPVHAGPHGRDPGRRVLPRCGAVEQRRRGGPAPLGLHVAAAGDDG